MQHQKQHQKISSQKRGDLLSEKPLVVCVGAQKAATTTLYSLMRAHPEVCASKYKETGFFYKEEQFTKGCKWHLDNDFSQNQDEKIWFEADPNYMFFPIAIDRISACNPSAKIIVMLRNPVLRAYSHYRMMRNAGYESLEFRDAYMAESGRLKIDQYNLETYSYLSRGFYGKQIKHIIKKFPKEQISYIVFEHFVKNQQEEYGKILRWLRLTNVKLPAKVQEIPELNYHPLRKFIPHPLVTLVKEFVSMVFGRRVFAVIGSSLKFRMKKAPYVLDITEDMYCELQKVFDEDIKQVESLTGLDLSIWKKYEI